MEFLQDSWRIRLVRWLHSKVIGFDLPRTEELLWKIKIGFIDDQYGPSQGAENWKDENGYQVCYTNPKLLVRAFVRDLLKASRV